MMLCQSSQKVRSTGIPTKIPDRSIEVPSPFLEIRDEITFDDFFLMKYKACYQGSKDDTVELNTNFKTIFGNFFKELVLAKELSQNEIYIVTSFMGRVASFNSLKLVFKDIP